MSIFLIWTYPISIMDFHYLIWIICVQTYQLSFRDKSISLSYSKLGIGNFLHHSSLCGGAAVPRQAQRTSYRGPPHHFLVTKFGEQKAHFLTRLSYAYQVYSIVSC